MRSARLALKHSKHRLSPTKSSTICLCHEAAQIKHKLSQHKAFLLGKNAKATQELVLVSLPGLLLPQEGKETPSKAHLLSFERCPNLGSKAETSLTLCSPFATKQTV